MKNLSKLGTHIPVMSEFTAKFKFHIIVYSLGELSLKQGKIDRTYVMH
jgi:hypothetical protein